MAKKSINHKVTIKPVVRDGQTKVLENCRRTLAPFSDEHGMLITGHTPKQEKEYKMIKVDSEFWNTFHVILTHKPQTLNLEIERDLIKYRFLRAHKEVACSTSEITATSTYVIYDEVEEAKGSNKEFDDKVKAFNYLSDMTESQRASFLRLYGHNTYNMNPEIIMSKIQVEIEKNPKIFIEKYEDENKETKLLLSELVEQRVIKKDKTSYLFGEIVIGANQPLALDFLNDAKNKSFREQLVLALRDAKEKNSKVI